MCRSVSGTDTAHTQRMVFTQGCCCHTCPRRKRCCLVCSSAACCLFVAQGSSCSSRDHTTLTRQTQVLPSCCPRAALVTDMTGFTRNVRTDAYPQKHAALLLRRARLLSCICTRKTVPLLFRTPQPVMCRSVSAVICVDPWNRYWTYTGSASFHLVCWHAYPTETCCVICYSACLCSMIEVHM